MSRLYMFSSVMHYDQTFRTRLSNKEVIRWDYHDNELRSACLIPRPKNTKAADYTSTESRLSYNEPQDRRVQPFRAPQRAIPPRAPTTTPFRSASIPSQPTEEIVGLHLFQQRRKMLLQELSIRPQVQNLPEPRTRRITLSVSSRRTLSLLLYRRESCHL